MLEIGDVFAQVKVRLFLYDVRITTQISQNPNRTYGINLVPRVFSLFKMAAAREKTLAHSRSRVSNENGDVFKMAATAKRVRRTGYEMLR